MERRFTSNEVAALTGMTPRQLQWWDERGIVVPAREGRRRLYSLDDLAEVAVIGQLRARGFSLQRVRKVIHFLQREFSKRLVQTVTAGSDYHLLSNGKNVYLETSPQQVVDILKNSRQPIFAICLSDTVRQIRADVGPSAVKRRMKNAGKRSARAPDVASAGIRKELNPGTRGFRKRQARGDLELERRRRVS
ncbi:MAG: MerR family transcriptional regulator [Terriglobales bacterium]